MLKIRLDNCCCEPNIKMEFTFEDEYFMDVLSIACGNFRSIRITNYETEEVVYTRYVDAEHFQIDQGYSDAITELSEYAHCPKEV